MEDQSLAEHAAAATPIHPDMPRGGCPVLRKDGKPCEAPPLSNGRCWVHASSPQEHALAVSKGGITTKARRVEIRVDLTSREGVRHLLEDTVKAVARGQLSPSAGNTIATLVNSSLRLAELELEARLLEIERQVQQEIERAQTRPGLSS